MSDDGERNETSRPRARKRDTRPAAPRIVDLGPVTRSRDRPGSATQIQTKRSTVLIALGVLLLCGVVATALFVGSLHHRTTAAISQARLPAAYAVLFVIDGASAADLTSRSMPNVASLTRRGVIYSNAWVGQAEASAQASNVTLATGTFPREHGVVGAVWRDATSGKPVYANDPVSVHLALLDQRIQATGVTPLAASIKTSRPNARVVSVGGAGCAAASAAGTWAADYVVCPVRHRKTWIPGAVVGHEPEPLLSSAMSPVPVGRGTASAALEGWNLSAQDDWVARYASIFLRQVKPRLMIVNFPEIAAVVRWLPPAQRAAAMQTLLKGIDRNIGQILAAARAAGTLDSTAFVLTSDGALAPFQRRVQRATLETTVLGAGGQLVYLQADGSGYLGLKDRLQSLPVAQAIQALKLPGVDGIYVKRHANHRWTYRQQYIDPGLSSGEAGAQLYLLKTMVSPVAPDVVVAYAPNTGTPLGPYRGFVTRESEHGLQWNSQHIPLILSGRGIQQGVTSSFLARLVDVEPTLAALLRLPAGGTSGVVLSDALTNPPNGSETRLRHAESQIQQTVRALKARVGIGSR